MNFNTINQTFLRNKYLFIIGGILIIYGFNLFIDVMDIDAAQYASISMEMSKNNSYLEVYHRGIDYLDKPPLLFWVSSLSMSLFGVNNFAYKLPSLLFALLGIYSTYRFAQLYYEKKTAIFSALILASSQALFLITNDIRTDTNLLAFVIFSIWQLSVFLRNDSWKNLLLGFIGIALAMLAKGPIGIVTVVIALGIDLLLKKEWKHIFNWKWIVGIIVAAMVLLPMTYGLYTQFDLHPEKTAYGIQSPSGVRFFYWTQSFGRITGESSWSNDPGFFFFFHSILWDLQPWVLFLILGFGVKIKSIFKRSPTIKNNFNKEYITTGGFLLVFLALSFSKYKLPHYIFVLFPFAAIIAADYLVRLTSGKKWVLVVQIVFNSLFWVLLTAGSIFFFPPENWILPIALILLFFSWILVLKRQQLISDKVFFGTIITSIAFNLLLASSFYPQLIGDYQGSTTIARMVHNSKIKDDQFYYYLSHEHSLDFYSQRIVPSIQTDKLDSLKSGNWVYTNKVGYDSILKNNHPFKVIKAVPDFPVTQLKIPFLYKETRSETLDTVYLLERK